MLVRAREVEKDNQGANKRKREYPRRKKERSALSIVSAGKEGNVGRGRRERAGEACHSRQACRGERKHVPDPRRQVSTQGARTRIQRPEAIKEQTPPPTPAVLETQRTDRRQGYAPRRTEAPSENKNQLREALAGILKEQQAKRNSKRQNKKQKQKREKTYSATDTHSRLCAQKQGKWYA